MFEMPDNYGLNKKGKDRVKDIIECASRAETIIKDLLDISRKKEIQSIVTNVIPLIEKSMQSIHIEGYKEIAKTIEVEPNLRPLICCDPSRIVQVFINLLLNAALSLIEKEKQEAGKKDGYVPKIKIEVKKEGNYIVVRILDNGIGIPPEKMPFIFDPFYTTRAPGEGTGLGLSICTKIMMEHNGRMYAESDSKRTVFTTEFPVSTKTP